MPKLPILLVIAGAVAALHVPVQADDDSRRAREGVRRGEFVPLERLLARAEREHPGEVLEVELDDGEYEIEILREDGRVVELTYDARSGRLLELEVDDDDDDD
ncbi:MULTISPECIES: PepSY domain-containing protein [Arenimonas]|uniref:PepSY domain-containing protein n=1 Tax=Arenimonas metalli CF5-1 TaxID=1384056 RepID=A0A091B5Z3_9GAMM|nr:MULTISPECIES: PepSY domain-containing protein [Arenimonas]KFN48048.1 hypothetical protein N787_06320 [Arenimonas metalli CF5-1]HEX4852799.1 PepSY domain-containing protein [Arenimonas sp.]